MISYLTLTIIHKMHKFKIEFSSKNNKFKSKYSQFNRILMVKIIILNINKNKARVL